MTTLDLDSLTPGQREHRARRLADALRFVDEPGRTPRGLLGNLARPAFVALTPEERTAHLTEVIDRETAEHLAEVAALREGPTREAAPRLATGPRPATAPRRQAPAPSDEPRATAAAPTPAPPRTRPGVGLDAVPVGGSVSGGRPADEQPQPLAETEQRRRQRGNRRERFTPGASVVRCVGCACWLPTRPGRSTVARCSPPKRNVKARAACGRWWPGASAEDR